MSQLGAGTLAVYKSRNMAELRHSFDGLKVIVDVELGLHVALAPCLVGYGEIVNWLDARLSTVTDERVDELVTIFSNATRLEIDFWQMGLDQSF